MRASIAGSIAILTLVSCQSAPPAGAGTSFGVCLTLSDSSDVVDSWVTDQMGEKECVSRAPPPHSATTVWSEWASDSNGYDPDAVELRAEKLSGGVPSAPKFPRPPDSHVSHDVDFRLLIQLNDAGEADGLVQATPWASEVGGWSPYAFDANRYDFDKARIGIETRPAPGLVVWDMRVGIRVADAGGSEQGTPQFSGWLLSAYGSAAEPKAFVKTDFATDPDQYDPDAVAIYLETRQRAPADSASDFKLCVRVEDNLESGPTDAGPTECTPYSAGTLGAVWTAWAYDGDKYDPDGVALLLGKYYPGGAFVLRDTDVRLLIQLTDAGEGAGEVQATPWASEGAGWSSYALDPNGQDFDGVRVGYETRPAPGMQVDTLKIGLRVADQGGAEEGFPIVLVGSTGWTITATDPNRYDPDAVAIYLETTTSTVP